MSGTPLLTAVAPHWHDEDNLALLARSWPRDGRFELIVVDNGSGGHGSSGPGSTRHGSGEHGSGKGSARGLAGLRSEFGADRPNVHLLEPGRNLGFAGAINRGAAAARGSLLLILNTDARPESRALESLIRGTEQHPEAAGLAPRLLDDAASTGSRMPRSNDSLDEDSLDDDLPSDDLPNEDGAAPQAGWQLRRLPGFRTLLGYCCFLEPRAMPAPAAGSPVEQPAACALLLRRAAFEAAGGMDEAFWPAWFEDVDLARRLRDLGETILYWPDAAFRHGLGASVPRLGYGPFLLAYYRNLDRYARKHHGRGVALVLNLVLVGAALLRIALLPLRRPRRARRRNEALIGLGRLVAAAGTAWSGQ